MNHTALQRSDVPTLLELFFEKYDEKKFRKIVQQTVTKIGQGYGLDDKKRETLTSITTMNENRKNHIFLFGSTGVGSSTPSKPG